MAEYYKRVIVEEPKLLRHQADTEDTPAVYVRYEPAADVVEVVHSEWAIIEFNKEKGFVTVECKNCGAAFTIEMFDYGLSYNFCPSCGAEMSGERRSE